jgi:hypothetical protein
MPKGKYWDQSILPAAGVDRVECAICWGSLLLLCDVQMLCCADNPSMQGTLLPSKV